MSKTVLHCILEAIRAGNVSSTVPTAQEIADAIVKTERDVKPELHSFVNTTALETLGYPAGTMGSLISIEDSGTGFVRWTIDGSNPTSTNGFTTTGPYHSGYHLRNVDLSQVVLDGSNAGSDYHVMVELYP